MSVRKITLGVLVALTATALGVVIAANPFAARASSVDGTEGPAVPSLHLTDGATSTYIGIAILTVSAAEAEQLGIDGGAKVLRVDENGPSNGILNVGDVITAVNGNPVASAGDVSDAVQATGVGDTLVFTVWRGGALLGDVSVAVGERAVKRRAFQKLRTTKVPDLSQMLIKQALSLGDRFARGEIVVADAEGNYQTYRAAIGIVTATDADAGTFTLQPRDGSDPIDYTISASTTVRLTRDGDIGELNLTDTTLVIDVDGEVNLVNQGPLPANKIGQRSQFGKGGRPGHGRFQRRGPGHGGFPRGAFGGGAYGIRDGGAAFGPSGLLDGLRLRLGELGGDGLLFHSLICDSEHLDKLPDSIVIRCETQSESGTAPANGDDAV